MITETGRIMAIDGDSIWVETINQSACGSCSAEKGCGQSVLAKWSVQQQYLQVPLNEHQANSFAVNDSVTIGIPDDVVVKSALLLYCLPLILLLLGAVTGNAIFSGDIGSVVGGIIGLMFGGILVTYSTRHLKRLKRFQPVIVDVFYSTPLTQHKLP